VSSFKLSGFNVETVEYKNIMFTVWDVGGQDKVCPPLQVFEVQSLEPQNMIAPMYLKWWRWFVSPSPLFFARVNLWS